MGLKLLLFVSPGCPHCPDAEVAVKKVVPEFYDNEVYYKKIRTRTSEGKELSRQYNVMAVPTIIIVDSDGNELKRIVGAPTKSKLRGEIEKQLGIKKPFFKKLFG